MRLAIATLVVCGCLPKPQKDYAPEEVASIRELQEVMRVQAHWADPQFGKRDQQRFSDAELGALEKTGVMLQATAKRVQGFAGQGEFDDGFKEYATRLEQHARSLEQAAAGKDAAKVRAALEQIRETCKSCHGVYR